MIINTRWWPAAFLAALILTGCGESPTSGGHDHGAGDSHGGHGDHGGGPALVYTHYTETSELFVEFPPLVAGETSRFAAHVTRLADYAPLTSGTLDVLLLDRDKTVARFRVNKPARTGIFTPAVTPRETGEFDLVVEVRDGDLQVRHELGPVTVFAGAASASVDQAAPAGDITYLKEQQWTNPFDIATVSMRPLRPSVPGFATVAAPADASATLRAPADGYFNATDVHTAGNSVETKTVLGYLIPRLGEATDIGNLLVDVERVRSKLDLARQDVDRLESLFEQGAIPERRLTEARQALDVARVELQTAQSRLAQQSGTSPDAGIPLRSPLGGELIAVNVRPGAFVKAGDPLFTIADSTRRWLDIRVPEKYAANLSAAAGAWLDSDTEGDAGTVMLDAANGAHVVQVETLIEPRSRTAGVTVEYPRKKGPAVVGARYPAHVLTGNAESRLAIPRSAVIDDGGQPVVYVQTGGETFDRRGVTLGTVDGEYVEILSGPLQPGDKVASEGAYYVKLAASGGDEIGHGHAH